MYSIGVLPAKDINPREKARTLRSLPELESFYYLKNFELVLSTIESRYSDLLAERELGFIAEFRQMPLLSRALFTRMVMRSGTLFRASRLNYPEVGETRAAAAPLIEAGWVTDQPLLKSGEFARLVTKEELITCLKLPRQYARLRKSDLQAMLSAQSSNPKSFRAWYGEQDLVYALLLAHMCERFRLMFFGNYAQTWTEFVTSDLGISRYEKVERSLHSRPFQTRLHIEMFQRLQECRELLTAGMPLDELSAIVPSAIEDSEWLEERRQKVLFLIAREYERDGQLPTALAQYLECNYRGARSRAIRLSLKAQNWEEARALCLLAKENPQGAAELQYVARALPRIHRRLKISFEPELAPVIRKFEVVLNKESGLGGVEYRVRDHLARDLADQSTVRYVENGLITALFGLLCWPAIFSAVPGAFFHDFHHGPADLESGHFYRRRRKEFDECLGHLDAGGHAKVIWKMFEQKRGIRSPFVRWYHLDKTLVGWALQCFPAAHLRLWFEWILRDVKDSRAGFPDLVQFYPDKRTYRLIEVKGPGDRLQDNQRRLLEYCVGNGMPVEVCWVRYADSTYFT